MIIKKNVLIAVSLIGLMCQNIPPLSARPDIRERVQTVKKKLLDIREAIRDKYDIHKAAREGNLSAITSLKKFANKKDKLGNTPLHLAVMGKYVDAIKLLVQLGAAVNAQNNAGFAPLHLAAEKGYLEIAQFLLQKGAQVDLTSQYRFTPINRAVVSGHFALVKLLHEKGANVNKRDMDWFTPLHQATFHHHEDIARYLLETAHANITLKNLDELTPFYYTVFELSSAIVASFIEKGADVNESYKGQPILHAAVGRIITFPRNPVHAVQIITQLVKNGAKVNAKDQHGNTVLYYLKQEETLRPEARQAMQFLKTRHAHL